MYNQFHSSQMKIELTRRALLKAGAISGGALLTGLHSAAWLQASQHRVPQIADSFAGGKRLGTVDFIHEGNVELGKPLGEELDGRLYTDFSALSPEHTVTPVDQFYIRTRASNLLADAGSWKVAVDGLVARPSNYPIADLRKAAKSMGTHVMECAGNVRLTRLSLISAGDWTGVPLAGILDDARQDSQATRVLITGFDQYTRDSVTSVAGASWIFSLEELKTARAFLATGLNDQALTKDHGAPIRLVVPGWYGCACIKWVNRISLVDETAEATSQMLEYAARTRQHGAPQFARDYRPALMEQAAMPIRVEKWSVRGKIKYRVVGILWGGTSPVKALQIRFNPEEDYVPVDNVNHSRNDPWTLWTHAWSPKAPGEYTIRLAVKDPPGPTSRLDSGHYARTVEITEIQN
jgi:DMSO/TMAO reductase YedYZ molybdopterin-dependent catalytic subunit